MFKSSFFWPNTIKKGIAVLLVVIMVPLRQTEWFGLMDSTYLVYGWLPAEMAFDLAYVIFGLGLVIFIIRSFVPETPEKYRYVDMEKEKQRNPEKQENSEDPRET